MPFSSVTIDTTLIVHAMDAELEEKLAGHHFVTTGVGKVNAVYELMRALGGYRAEYDANPSLILNVGSAGSTFFEKGAVVNCTRFIQRDMSAVPLGFKPYETPFDELPHILVNGLRSEAYPEGICGTGDNFVTEVEETAWNVVDMEAYALAKICYKEALPFCCVKYITDGADDKAAELWEGGLDNAATALMKAIKVLIS